MTPSPVEQDRRAPRPTDEPPAFQAHDASLPLQTYLERLTLPPLYNLPVTLTDFIGRQAELATLHDLLSQQRLVSLVGLGGAGKTRLALQIASELRAAFADGVCFVPLLAVHSPDLLVSALADAIQLPVYQDADLQGHLLNYLRDKHLLLVLDNLEHLLPATSLVIEILERAPNIKILTTSRERLNLYGEWVFEVGGLCLPEGEGTSEIEASDAARLFLHSARRVCSDFSLGVDDRRHVARICQLVGGLPLALELAGAWVKVLSCQEIASKIERDLGFLNTDWSNMPERHRSLQAVLKHSWNLLGEQEQQVFERLSVFVGGFSKEAAEQVAGASLNMLAALVDHSFLSWNPERRRYTLHPLLQRYAEEGLDKEAGDLVRDLHCAYFMGFLREREESVQGEQQLQILQEIGEEIGNLHAAWRWAVEHGKTDCLADGLETLYQFYEIRSRFQEGQELCAWTVEKGASQWEQQSEKTQEILLKLQARQGVFLSRLGKDTDAQGRLQAALAAFRIKKETPEIVFCLNTLSRIALRQGKIEQARECAGEALSLVQVGGLRRLEAECLHRLGVACYHLEDFTRGKAYVQQALEIHQELGNRRGEGMLLHAFHLFRVSTESDKNVRCCQRALDIFSQLGDRQWASVSLEDLGTAYSEQGHYSRAIAYYEQSLALARQIDDRSAEGRTLFNIGETFLDLGKYEQAQDYLEQALSVLREMSNRRGQSHVLDALGRIAYQLERYETSCEHHQQALILAKEIGNRSRQGYALTALGWALVELGQLAEANSAYREALTLRREIGQPVLAIMTLAGLALVALARENLPEAQSYTAEILQVLPGQKPGCEFDLFQVYLTCYQVLRASHDPRATDIMHTAHGLLQEQAATIHEEDLRHSFLENIKTHREIEREFAALEAIVASDKENLVTTSQPASELVEPLTPQEVQVLRLLAEGLTNRQIAERLVITVGTVKFHTHSLYGKLGVESRTQAVARARALNLI